VWYPTLIQRGNVVNRNELGAKRDRVNKKIRLATKSLSGTGLPDFSWRNIPKREKYTK
jgi:hypothetical protein